MVAQYHLSTYHNTAQTLLFYRQTALDTLGIAQATLSALALIVFLTRRFGKPEMFAALMLLAPVLLYLAAMFRGQILLSGPATLPINIHDPLFQARLGAVPVAPTAIFVATLTGGLASLNVFSR